MPNPLATTLAAMTAAAPELTHTPMLTMGVAQGAGSANPTQLARTTATSLFLLGMKQGASQLHELLTDPDAPE